MTGREIQGEYQRGGISCERLPQAIYNQVLWVIRDYNRMKTECDAILHESPLPPDGQPRASSYTDKIGNKVIRRDALLRKIKIIDDAFQSIPLEYRKGIWKSIMYRTPYPDDADRSTYSRWRMHVIQLIAKKLDLL